MTHRRKLLGSTALENAAGAILTISFAQFLNFTLFVAIVGEHRQMMADYHVAVQTVHLKREALHPEWVSTALA